MGASAPLERFVALLILSGKNVLLVGAPGVGKTELALRAARFFTCCEPEVEAGREDLSYEDLVWSYAVGPDGKLERRLGSLGRAVKRSWESLAKGGGPCHYVLDEINRANIDVALGRVFTALDVEHRPRVKVFEEAGVEPPLIPTSLRVFATMNVVDRGQLFKLSFALLRRFAYVYVPPPHKSISPRLEIPHIIKRDIDFTPYAERAYKSLTINGVGPGDIPTILKLPIPQPGEILAEVDRLGLTSLLNWALEKAERLGLEVGPSMILDVLKIAAVRAAAPNSLKLEKGAFIDFVASSLVLPYFASAAPRVRQKAILSARPPGELEEMRKIVNEVKEFFGETSASYTVARGLLYELPAEV
ncbi:hypothetical protein PAE3687 [Pyrobaculum aerophilum str. IM2]|uniref:AAA+ ATPase domain-containing protein n=2 Tax=Pyrobaculum aerophilum TaxID=13773 RepID=Q8ZSL8_PYRAE|nr:McrB family protein [Pyrobaculum aerophilum]AAL65095.1 hypothetical protein PAE3687 [Pyrobaculum aerophilum str. IM2]HII47778.1 McrB family protein [Pyrobaculum aerophilum]